MAESYDYIVVGAGSAGCAVAARLSEDARLKVLLLEAGPADNHLWIHIPIGYARTFLDEKVNWKYETDAEPHLDNRKIYWPRGKTLGGSSSINGLIYIRGIPSDFDYWRQLGNTGWGFDDVLPYFKKAESNVRGDDALHGGKGPLGVDDMRWRNALSEAYVEAAVQAGYPRNNDFNGPRQEGVGYYQLTTRGGRRCSSARAYLQPARGRANLRVVTGALTEKVVIEDGRATGVRYRVGDRVETATAGREVILCGGAINSPQLLMLSGVGPAEHLAENGIEVKRHLPGVGENLHDHYQCRQLYRCCQPGTMNEVVGSVFGKMRMGLDYALGRRGLLTVGAGLVGVFLRTRPELEDPDIQLHFIPFSTDKMGTTLHDFPGFTVTMNQSRPQSRGRLRLRSADARQHPSMVANYLADESDRRTAIAGLKAVRHIAQQPALKGWIDEELLPGSKVQSDAQWLEFLRGNGGSIYHPVGTCKMGTDNDKMAVVDERLRVRGIEGLRIADGSVMPQVVSGNTNAACIMIGEKCADMIRAAAA
ncbi:choline dehydrogenase [Vineibacter terrae]|uniref:GMC family oxidoreductase n=1 Tax=Vineibacter terrae TaxID=2586908 RepID=UPI002E34840F|nr:choline dehydrogenase [Vineibacter terrae]HEX2885001.1 choline dehydrogenase [Vineibacter terrae]